MSVIGKCVRGRVRFIYVCMYELMRGCVHVCMYHSVVAAQDLGSNPGATITNI
jgi:hypothetical protein